MAFHKAIIFTLLLGASSALQVSPNSPCSNICIDNSSSDPSLASSSNTGALDVVCNNTAYDNTDTGQKFKACLNCLQTSSYSSEGESDQGWFLFNLRYTVDWCLFGSSNSTSKCLTSASCGPLQNTLDQNLDPKGSEFDYCTADNGSFTGGSAVPCAQCLLDDADSNYLANFMVALAAGCQQHPGNNSILNINGTVFSTTLITATSSSTYPTSTKKGLSLGAKIGIIVGGVILLLVVLGFAFYMYKRRNKNYNLDSGFDPRFGAAEISAPHQNGFNSHPFSSSNSNAPILSPKSFTTTTSTTFRHHFDAEKAAPSPRSDVEMDVSPASRRASVDTQFSDVLSETSGPLSPQQNTAHSLAGQLSPNPPPSVKSQSQRSPSLPFSKSQTSPKPRSLLTRARSPPPAALKPTSTTQGFTPVPVHAAWIPTHSPAYSFSNNANGNNNNSPQSSPPIISPSRTGLLPQTGSQQQNRRTSSGAAPLGSSTLSSRDDGNGPRTGNSILSMGSVRGFGGSPATSPRTVFTSKEQPSPKQRTGAMGLSTKSAPTSPQPVFPSTSTSDKKKGKKGQIIEISGPVPQTTRRAEVTGYTAMDMDSAIAERAQVDGAEEPDSARLAALQRQMQAQAEAMVEASYAQERTKGSGSEKGGVSRSESRLGGMNRLLTRAPKGKDVGGGKKDKAIDPPSPETDTEQWPGAF